ncbi:hypothetical protein EZV73_15980 [Acidaminobacter sp. JC074]|uniref:VOC family protein n=1 Tax=Acidaminobacter sp. JC074 TaxID=2530199 RepID=UPI001F10B9CB|nr:VOC family protein [Acidaminobacter sp. JC074]MCH4889095.1 hypothetical protein [Acidaminobacter sp. JC074]
MAKITGLGGVFIKTKSEVTRLLEWYRDVLELDITEYGLNFLVPNELTLITFEASEGETVLNFTVDNLDDFINMLKEKSVQITSPIKEYDYGKFAQIKDPFGNIVELWETRSDNYIQMVRKEIHDYKK